MKNGGDELVKNVGFQPKMGISLQSGSVNDGILYCKVTRDPVTIVNDRTFNLITDKFYILVASGSNAGCKCCKTA